jgi:hypothetical protein
LWCFDECPSIKSSTNLSCVSSLDIWIHCFSSNWSNLV